MRKFCLVTSHISKSQQLEKMPVRGLYGKPTFQVPFWSIIYVASKFTLHVSEIEFVNFSSK